MRLPNATCRFLVWIALTVFFNAFTPILTAQNQTVLPLLRSSTFDGRSYGIATFPGVLDEERLHALEVSGIRVLEYVGNRQYLLSVPLDLPENMLAGIQIRAVARSDKWSGGNTSDETDLSEQRDLFLRYFEDIPPGRIAEQLNLHGIRSNGFVDLLPAVLVSVSNQQLIALLGMPWVQFVGPAPNQPTTDQSKPTFQTGANQLVSTEQVPYIGRGVLVGLGDDGAVGPHIDLQGRVSHLKEVPVMNQNGIHADLVAGLLAGAGNRRPEHQGIAPGATLLVFDGMDVLLQAAQWHELQDLAITCTALSDGCNEPYSLLSSLADRQMFQYHGLTHVFSAGNAGQEDCGYGAGPGWGNITGGAKVAKNGLTVGNTDSEDQVVFNSSRGPAPDGRIKPDLCAPGTQITSTLPEHEYGELNGTSASAPVVAGILARLVEAWRDWTEGAMPPSDVLKATLLNTAEDLGTPGPDFQYGFGRVNAEKAFRALKNGHYFTGTVNHENQQTFMLNVPEGLDHVKVLLYWHDREASPFAQQSLVTDLDLTVLSPQGATLLPLVPDHQPEAAQLAKAAMPGRDSINNAEQMILETPKAGLYKITVKGTEVPLGAQDFVVSYVIQPSTLDVIYPDKGENLKPDTTIRIVWNAAHGALPFHLSYSADEGQSWEEIGEVPAHHRSAQWTVPDWTLPGHVLIKVTRGEEMAVSERPSLISQSPKGLKVEQKCPDFTRISWHGMPEANSYAVYLLGATNMEHLLSVTDTVADIPLPSPFDDHWLAVAAIFDSATVSGRSEAVCAQAGLKNCQAIQDIGLMGISSPANGFLPDCFDHPLPLSFTFRNDGLQSLEGCCFDIQLDGVQVATYCYSAIIPVGVPINVIIDSILPLDLPGTYELAVIADLTNDEVPQNDTLRRTITVIGGATKTLPYVEEFEGPAFCFNSDGCELSCLLPAGWRNELNGTAADQTDWRVGSNVSPSELSSGVLPAANSFSAGNTCLLLGSTGSCASMQGHLLSPCIDLSEAAQPAVDFWYLLYGQGAGALYVDAFDGHIWHLNICPPIIGNQGEQWEKVTVPLNQFAGSTMILRFRGISGDTYLSQLALDRIVVYDREALPLADFSAAFQQACPGTAVKFFDHSLNHPDMWNWAFDPPLAEFLNGTNEHSPNPIVAFPETGTYTVTLQVSKSGGESTIASRQFMVSAGDVPPIRVNFEQWFGPLPEDWQIINPDGEEGWERVQVLGKLGLPTHALQLNNHNYLKINEQDILRTSPIDLTDLEEPRLRFDLAYALYSANFLDRLLVKVYPDCGNGDPVVVFDQNGPELTTVPDKISGWTPTEPHHWSHRMVDLSAFAGQSVIIEFVNICGFGNRLFLDNLLIHEKGAFPDLQLSWLPQSESFCIGDTVEFDATVNEQAIFGPLFWTFGRHARPAFAFGPGPHKVVFDVPHSPHIRVRAMGPLGFDQAFGQLRVVQFPEAAFEFDRFGTTVEFENQSIAATSYSWRFGDGSSSTDPEPEHTYETSGAFLVSLAASNICGTDTSLMLIDGITATNGYARSASWSVFPNPASNWLNIDFTDGIQQAVRFDVLDLHGRQLATYPFERQSAGAANHRIPLSDLAPGSYIGRLSSGNREEHLIFVKLP